MPPPYHTALPSLAVSPGSETEYPVIWPGFLLLYRRLHFTSAWSRRAKNSVALVGSIVTALARLDGHPVGVVAGDPYVAGGALTVQAAEAVTRLVDLCSAFHLPVVTFTDQPGLLIGTRAEQRATIRHGVRAIAAVYQAGVPGAEIIMRRVFGVGGAGLTNRHRLTRRWAWPSADWGSLPAEGGIEAAYRADLEQADDWVHDAYAVLRGSAPGRPAFGLRP